MTETTFQARLRDGSVRSTPIRIATPRKVREGEWICHVEVSGFLKRTGVRGGDALQALCLGLELVGGTLYEARRRGVRFEFSTGEVVPLHAYFRLREWQHRLKHDR